MIISVELNDSWAARTSALQSACRSAGLGENDKKYKDADDEANRLRDWHQFITVFCVLPGTLALLLSILQLEFVGLKTPEWTGWVEFGLVVITAAGVFLGYLRRSRDGWLYTRYKAERFRSAAFQVMIEPEFWGPVEPAEFDWHLGLEAEERHIESIRTAEEAAERDEPLRIPEPEVCAVAIPELTRLLGLHYRANRLEHQIRYLEQLIRRREGNLLNNPVLQPSVFILSVAAVFIHLAFEVVGRENWSAFFVYLSAAIPIAWTGIRTWRGANEYARNVSRSRAKKELLQAQSDWLEKELAEPSPDRFRVFTALAISENLLRNELREWLRLMLDTEWYG